MSEALTVDLFAEDRAHEEFIKAVIQRLAQEAGREIRQHVRSARGGHGRAVSEFKAYQASVRDGIGGLRLPDVVCVAIDANCKRFTAAKKSLEEAILDPFKGRVIIACPDPHIERWYMSDPESFYKVVGAKPKVTKRKCRRDLYKRELARAVKEGGHPPTLGGIEFAAEIVAAMDLYKAGKSEPSLKHFIQGVLQRFKLA